VVTKQCILIVEDEQTVANALLRALNTPRGGGYTVESCDSAEAALERLAAGCFDLIISDLRLPGMDGLQLIELARRRYPDLHFVLITAYGSPRVEEQARHLTDAFVAKPFRLRDMIQIVGRVLNQEPGLAPRYPGPTCETAEQ
jgi:DNA-binding NtrC family response regulator